METPEINSTTTAAIQASEAEVASEVSDTIAAQTPQSADMSTLVAEAEQRGYLRGRNEVIAEQLTIPGLWEEPDTRNEVSILDNLRPGVWD